MRDSSQFFVVSIWSIRIYGITNLETSFQESHWCRSLTHLHLMVPYVAKWITNYFEYIFSLDYLLRLFQFLILREDTCYVYNRALINTINFSIIGLSRNCGCYTNNCGAHSIILKHSLFVFSSVVLPRYATAPALARLILTLKTSYVP